jgi:succinate dehydrogenase / fumarate reductase cytochrome b subunit
MNDGKLHYGFYSGCCFQGADARFFEILQDVFDKIDVKLHLIEEAVCCGSGVIEERSELTSLAVNAKNMAHAEQMGLPLYTPCSTCYNVISNAQKRMQEDPALHKQVNEILAEQGLEYKGECQITHTLWVIAQDVGLDKLKETITNPLNGLRVASYYGCHTRNPSDIQGYESSNNPTSLEDILRVLGVEIVDFDTKDDCCGYHLAWPNNELNMSMTSHVLSGAHDKDVDLLVTSCPLCFKSMDGSQAKALAQTGHNFQLPVLFLPELVGLACGMTPQDMMLQFHGVPVNIRL